MALGLLVNFFFCHNIEPSLVDIPMTFCRVWPWITSASGVATTMVWVRQPGVEVRPLPGSSIRAESQFLVRRPFFVTGVPVETAEVFVGTVEEKVVVEDGEPAGVDQGILPVFPEDFVLLDIVGGDVITEAVGNVAAVLPVAEAPC